MSASLPRAVKVLPSLWTILYATGVYVVFSALFLTQSSVAFFGARTFLQHEVTLADAQFRCLKCTGVSRWERNSSEWGRALTVSSGDGQVEGVKHCAGNLPQWWQARRCRGSRFGDSDPPMRSANTACWGSSSRCLPVCRALKCDKSFKATCNFTLRFSSSCWDTSAEWDPKWPTGQFWLS